MIYSLDEKRGRNLTGGAEMFSEIQKIRFRVPAEKKENALSFFPKIDGNILYDSEDTKNRRLFWLGYLQTA